MRVYCDGHGAGLAYPGRLRNTSDNQAWDRDGQHKLSSDTRKTDLNICAVYPNNTIQVFNLKVKENTREAV